MVSDMPPGFFSAIHSRTRAALFEWTMSKKIGFASALLVLDLRHELLSEPPHRRNILPCTAVRHACFRKHAETIVLCNYALCNAYEPQNGSGYSESGLRACNGAEVCS